MSYKDYKPIDIEFNGDKVEDREAVVTLDNGTEIHISACYESWQQYGGCHDELVATVNIAECINDWLHVIEDEPPAEVYDYIESNN
jgi:hypothetical protein